MRTLFDDVRSEQNIFSAWRHVKRSALTSDNRDIRGMASEFEHAHQRHLRRIITQLREDRFSFDAVEGVLKDKKKREALNKDPRPIAIATLKNRVVQRAILQALQPRIARDPRDVNTRYETTRDSRLGKINDVNRSEFGVGGLIYPYGGVQPAIKKITEAIDAGAGYFYQSDIKSFFTAIRTAPIVDFVRRETGDDALADLFERALDVHLANEDELKGYAKLFPKGGIGVAQGSSLSAFAGNVLLYDLDHELNAMNVTAVRYIDDILVVAGQEADLDAAVAHAKARLVGLGFDLYAPAAGSDKAAKGLCRDAMNFLGCTIQPNRCVPSGASLDKIKHDVSSALSSSRAAIASSLKSGKPLDPEKSQSAVLQALSKKVYGWQKSFSFCNQAQPFRQLDAYVAEQVRGYMGFIFRNLGKVDLPSQMMILGMPSTEGLHKD